MCRKFVHSDMNINFEFFNRIKLNSNMLFLIYKQYRLICNINTITKLLI